MMGAFSRSAVVDNVDGGHVVFVDYCWALLTEAKLLEE